MFAFARFLRNRCSLTQRETQKLVTLWLLGQSLISCHVKFRRNKAKVTVALNLISYMRDNVTT